MLKSTAKLAAARRPLGFQRSRLLLALVIATLLAGFVYDMGRQLIEARQCRSNLAAIFRGIELHESSRGVLPRLSFFPDNPFDGETSLRAVLGKFAVDSEAFVCPGCRARLRGLGLTYVWNVELNARRRADFAEPEWMLTEINALNPRLDRPHPFHYNVLYTDGSVRKLRQPPAGFPSADQL